MNVPNIIIAVDGYSSTGKSTFAKLLAKELGFLYLDSGALYRGVTLFALENGYFAEDGVNFSDFSRELKGLDLHFGCLLYTSPSPRDISGSRMPSSA